ncbi:MAG: PAS domain S-box protein, partial [Deltaproteobacteria bacterium]|nr:PAS domain S-box protein [Deltaproteobacteria bacterium]
MMTREPKYEKLEKRIRELEETLEKYQQEDRKLREDQSFRSAIIMHAAEGICVCHEINEYPYVRFTIWNDQMKKLSGYTMEEINRLGWYQTVYPDPAVQERAIKRMGQMRVGSDLIREEWEITRKDREKRTFNISTSILETDDGKKHALGMMSDVTESKQVESILKKSQADLERQVSQGTAELIKANEALKDEISKHQLAENALKQSEEKFAKAFHSSPNAITISRIDDGLIFEVNEGFTRFFGYSHEETIGRHATELNIWVDPEDRKRYVSIMQEKGGIKDREFRFSNKSGSTQIGLLSGETINIGDELCLLSTIVD